MIPVWPRDSYGTLKSLKPLWIRPRQRRRSRVKDVGSLSGRPCEAGQTHTATGCIPARDAQGNVKPVSDDAGTSATVAIDDDLSRAVSESAQAGGDVGDTTLAGRSQGVEDETGRELASHEQGKVTEAAEDEVEYVDPEDRDLDDAVIESDGLSSQWIEDWKSYDDDGNLSENEIYIVMGTATFEDGAEVDVYRWESVDPDGDRLSKGEWTTDEKAATKAGQQHAADSNQDPPDLDLSRVEPEEKDSTYRHIENFSEYDGDDEVVNEVYLQTGEVEWAGDTVTVYRWGAYSEGAEWFETGDWTEDRRQATRDGERYARDHHQEPPESESDTDLLDNLLNGDEDNAAVVVGAPSDASVNVTYESGEIKVSIEHPSIESCDRTLGVDDNGQKFVHNDYLRIRKEEQGSGFAAQLFARQVAGAKAQGFDYIETHAAGSYSSPYFNGYYTWPLFGYNQSLDELADQNSTGREVVSKAAVHFPDAESVLDIFSVKNVQGLSEEEADEIREKCAAVDTKLKKPVKDRTIITGRDWWLVHGCDLYHAKFDLSDGSRSLRVLDNYMKNKKQKEVQS